VGIAELRDFDSSTVRKGQRIEEDSYILAPVLMEAKVPARTEWD
jgi:hypothetical protein